MRKILSFFLFFFFVSLVAFSQSRSASLKLNIDSLQNLIDENPKGNIAKVKHLNFLARYYFKDTQYIKGFQILKQGKAMAESLGYKEGEALYFQSMSIAHPYDLQTYFFIKSKWIYQALNINENLHESARELKSIIPSQFGADLDLDMAFLYSQYDKIDRDILEESIKSLTESDREISAYISYHLYQSYLGTSDYDLALSSLDTAIEEFNRIDQTSLVILLSILKCRDFREAIGLEETNKLESRIIELMTRLGNNEESALLNTYLFYYYLGSNRQTIAIQKALDAKRQLESADERLLNLLLTNQLGVQFGVFGMLEKANEYMLSGIEMMLLEMEYNRDEGYGSVISNQYFEVGFNNIELGNLKEAETNFNLAREVMNSRDELRTNRGLLFRNGDSRGQMEMALGNYQKALNIFHEVENEYGDIPWIFYIHYYMAECYLELGDWKNSLRYALLSYNRMDQTGTDSNLLVRVRLLLSDVYGHLGDMENSILYLQKFREFITNRNELNLANQTQKMEVEAMIQKSEETRFILEQEKHNQLMIMGFLGSTLLLTIGFLFFSFSK